MDYCNQDPESPVTHVIFDVDGTILDTESLYNKAKQKVGVREIREFKDLFIKITWDLHTYL